METCKPVVSCVCPPSTAGVRMHCAGMLGAEKPYHHVPLLLRLNRVWGCRLSADTTFHVTLVICTLPDL